VSGRCRPTIAGGPSKGKRILVRVDFNTPVAEVDGRLEVTDDFRIRACLPLFEELLSRGATVVACTHFGRPNGKVDERTASSRCAGA
jgi:phosphoglycerate kinase